MLMKQDKINTVESSINDHETPRVLHTVYYSSMYRDIAISLRFDYLINL